MSIGFDDWLVIPWYEVGYGTGLPAQPHFPLERLPHGLSAPILPPGTNENDYSGLDSHRHRKPTRFERSTERQPGSSRDAACSRQSIPKHSSFDTETPDCCTEWATVASMAESWRCRPSISFVGDRQHLESDSRPSSLLVVRPGDSASVESICVINIVAKLCVCVSAKPARDRGEQRRATGQMRQFVRSLSSSQKTLFQITLQYSLSLPRFPPPLSLLSAPLSLSASVSQPLPAVCCLLLSVLRNLSEAGESTSVNNDSATPA